jgi:S4 domain protein YaaA
MPGESEFKIRDEYITLGQLLKAANLVGTGGEVKPFLAAGGITVNGEDENRRGKKLRPGDLIKFPNGTTILIA